MAGLFRLTTKGGCLMPKRLISTDVWSDAFVERLSYKAKYLFLYLITSPYTSQAGIGLATDKKIANDTDLNREDLPGLFSELSEIVSRKAEWFWIKNFFKHQCCNSSFAKGALKYAKNTPFFEEFKELNQVSLNTNTNINRSDQIRSDQEVSTPCRHPPDTVSTPCHENTENYPHPSRAMIVHNELLKALNKIQVSPEEIMIAEQLVAIGCNYDDIAAARKLKGKNSLQYLKNVVCECRDQRKTMENADDIPV